MTGTMKRKGATPGEVKDDNGADDADSISTPRSKAEHVFEAQTVSGIELCLHTTDVHLNEYACKK